MKNYPEVGVHIPDILLPKASLDYTRWAVIAVDQFTSQPDYWQRVEALVGDAPSTLHMVLPEIYLGKPDEAQRIACCNAAMQECLARDYFHTCQGLVLVERSFGGRTRHGLLLALDLDAYSYARGSKSPIRASEQTILDRIPPRKKIRQQAALEIPHILVLVDDPDHTVIQPLAAAEGHLKKLYDFDLMEDSGHLRGYLVEDEALLQGFRKSLQNLADPASFAARYGLLENEPALLFAVGDGNHSLATAKSVWEEIKPAVSPDHPARYALVEVENIHDDGLVFEPIHRILFNIRKDIVPALKDYFGSQITFLPWLEQTSGSSGLPGGEVQPIWLVNGPSRMGILINAGRGTLAVSALQGFLDDFMSAGGAESIDYVHGGEVVQSLASQPGNAGFILPPLDKNLLFETIIRDGVLPRKAFSMGEAREKRFYLECRKIVEG